ncbi:MAG: tripartite tricarboxylate transporter permease [Thermoleophilum sp.]|nr:tripartite tricarboxylate transporter permease [Thermoleophilum sp.]
MAHGMRPGPQIFEEQGPLVYALLFAIVIANVLFLAVGYRLLKPFVAAIQARKAYLVPVIVALAFVGTLLVAASIVFANVVAMRAGLVSRFLGIVGIIVGALHVLPLAGGPQILQVFWLGALALLFLDRWPGGRGPAWSSGQAEPWPVPQRR